MIGTVFLLFPSFIYFFFFSLALLLSSPLLSSPLITLSPFSLNSLTHNLTIFTVPHLATNTTTFYCCSPSFLSFLRSLVLTFPFKTPQKCKQKIPASALLIQILKTQNQQPDSMRYGITLTPTLSIGVDIMGIGVVLVTVMGLLGVAKGCRRLMNFYFGLVMCFIAIQVGYAVVGFMSGTNWVHEALEKSWDKAYLTDKSLIHDLQIESRCQGFYSRGDRAVAMPPSMENYLAPCAEVLNLRFGKRLQRMGYLILCIRMIQLTGVFLLSVLFKHLAVLDQENTEDEDNIKIDEESPYFKSEKQLEYESSCVPLLADEEEEDLPHYSAYDYNDNSEYCEDCEDEDSGDDEERLLGSREYRHLPEYTEDECEPQVYVA